MITNFQRALRLVLKHEGGYVNHPDDPGGATNKGITIATYRQFVKPNATIADLKAISDADVARVYKLQYWAKVQGDRLPDGLDYAVFDFAVNSGPGRAAQFLQDVLGVTADGQIGPETLAAASRDPAKAIANLCDKRLAWLKGLKTWPTFGKGWAARVKAVKAAALKWDAEAHKASPARVETPKAEQPAEAPERSQQSSAPESVAVQPPKGWLAGLAAAALASFAGMMWAAACSMPQFIIDWLGYAGRCTGGN